MIILKCQDCGKDPQFQHGAVHYCSRCKKPLCFKCYLKSGGICKKCKRSIKREEKKLRKIQEESLGEEVSETQKRSQKKFREILGKTWTNHHRVYQYCWQHNLPTPTLKKETWKEKKVRVSRRANGQFISWKKDNVERGF